MINHFVQKVSVVAMMMVSVASLIGCSASNQERAEDALALLKSKYSQEFIVSPSGSHNVTSSKGMLSVVAQPADNDRIVFKAVLDKDGTLKSDTYISRIISGHMNELLKQELGAIGIESETYTYFADTNGKSGAETNPSITLAQYVQAYQPSYFSGFMIVKDTSDLSPDQFEKALTAVYKAASDRPYQVEVSVIASDQYEQAADSFARQPDITSGWFSDYKVLQKFDAVADEKGYHYQITKAAQAAGDGE
ncbi:hypothetical protein PCCS19_51560 [Paenibacillus sp. CCS19]|nr:hypothetical protein PCCS19_51560 [Paenibacillus cellulosilyticus]